MLSSSSESAPDPTHLTADQAREKFAQINPNLDSSLNLDQIFQLIDRVLPFEVCLYHQLLPLLLENGQLLLGMVDPTDQGAIDYIRPMLSFIHCDLVPQRLAVETHNLALSAYLSYSGKQLSREGSVVLQSPVSVDKTQPEQPQPNRLMEDPSNNPTLLVDSPIYLLEQEGYFPKTPSTQKHPLPDSRFPSVTVSHRPPRSLLNQPESSKLQNQFESKQEVDQPTTEDPQLALSIQSKYPFLPLEQLLNLTPASELLQELLVRVLASGIGRLYFEQQSQYGRILWSQDGKVQEVLHQVPPSYIAQLIDGLKGLTHAATTPVQSLHQVEIERFYQGERLLLRLRLMPGTYGEEATLQILRGTALRFYQQQQLATLERDALGIAQKLQHKIDELRSQTLRYPQMAEDQLTMLPDLDQVIQSIEAQITALKGLRNTLPRSAEQEKNGSARPKKGSTKRNA